MTLNATLVNDYAGGGVSVLAGTLTAYRSEIARNGHASDATFGGIEMVAPGGTLSLIHSSVRLNGVTSDTCYGGVCVRGGGLRIVGSNAVVSLSASSIIERNRAYEGDQIYVDTAFADLTNVRYTLPTPLGHYVIITDRGTGSS